MKIGISGIPIWYSLCRSLPFKRYDATWSPLLIMGPQNHQNLSLLILLYI